MRNILEMTNTAARKDAMEKGNVQYVYIDRSGILRRSDTPTNVHRYLGLWRPDGTWIKY